MVYFTQKILRFLARLAVKLVLWPFRLAWRLIKRKRGGYGGSEDWTDLDAGSDAGGRDEATAGSGGRDGAEATAGDGGGTATSSDAGASKAAAATEAGTAAAGATLGRFRRVLLGAGVASGLSALLAPFLHGLPFRYLGMGGLLPRLALDLLAPLLVVGICARGLDRRQEWAWYAAVGWGGLVVLTYFLRGLFPWFLLSPFAGAWQVIGNLGAFLGLYDPLGILSAAAVGGAVLWTGYRAHPDRWSGAVESIGEATADAHDLDVAEEADLAEPTGGTSTATPDEPGTESGEGVETPGADPAQNTGTPDAAPEAGTPDAGASDSGGEPTPGEGDAPTQAAGSENDARTQSESGTEGGEPADEPDGDAAEEGTSDLLADHRDDLVADDPATRREAVRALADAAADEAVPEQAVIDALAARLADDEDADVRVAACEALGQLGTGGGDARSILEDHRLDPDGDVSRAASRALRNID